MLVVFSSKSSSNPNEIKDFPEFASTVEIYTDLDIVV